MLDTLLKSLIAEGAPWGILCTVLITAVAVLWRRNAVLSDRVYALGMKQVEASTEVHNTLSTVQKDLEILKAYERPRS